jgi:hypothetical protein
MGTDPIFRKMGSVPIFCGLLLLAAVGLALGEERTLQLPSGETIAYSVIQGDASSARDTAYNILRHLAQGDIESAALISNAPRRRFEVLRDYRERVGHEEFRRVFSQYFVPENRVVAELARGPRRLVIWDLGQAAHHLAGQYFVEIDGRFVIDDVPNEERAKLQRILNAYRSGKLSP